MLDFYGMHLVDDETGAIDRAAHWQLRYQNLTMCPHNNLRITRIIKCLGELGLSHYQAPLCEHLFKEIFVSKKFGVRCTRSLVDYWIPVIKDDAARERLETDAQVEMI